MSVRMNARSLTYHLNPATATGLASYDVSASLVTSGAGAQPQPEGALP